MTASTSPGLLCVQNATCCLFRADLMVCSAEGSALLDELLLQTSSQSTSPEGKSRSNDFVASFFLKACHRPTCGTGIPGISDLNDTTRDFSKTANEQDTRSSRPRPGSGAERHPNSNCFGRKRPEFVDNPR